jgi:hypothetical protein
MLDRTRKDFPDADIAKITGTYHAWRDGTGYADLAGFCEVTSRSAPGSPLRSGGTAATVRAPSIGLT